MNIPPVKFPSPYTQRVTLTGNVIMHENNVNIIVLQFLFSCEAF